MIERLPGYYVAHNLHTTPALPMNYTLGLTYDCNSRCKTCRVYERDRGLELNAEEWRELFNSLGTSPYWVTFTGGEPFLYRHLIEVYYHLCKTCHPAMVNIPTNGLLPDRITDWVWQMSKLSPRTSLTVNVSIDHIGPKDDEIRGRAGAYIKAVMTVQQLQALHLPNLKVGIHTVLSQFNVQDFSDIHQELSALLNDSSLYITEIAENRVELGTMRIPIAPNVSLYNRAISYLKSQASLKGALRSAYYKKVVHGNWPPCYAGYASCQVTPNGDVWFCCMKAISIGNIRAEDFRTIWAGAKACQLRANQNCSCTLANAAYTNMLMHPPTLAEVAIRMLKGGLYETKRAT